jgi:hypothetical protein
VLKPSQRVTLFSCAPCLKIHYYSPWLSTTGIYGTLVKRGSTNFYADSDKARSDKMETVFNFLTEALKIWRFVENGSAEVHLVPMWAQVYFAPV